MKPDIQPEIAAFLDREHGLLIGGEWVPAQARGLLETINPATERPLARFSGAAR